KDIPLVEEPLTTQKGSAYLQKTDIFKKIMWFGYKEETTWYPLSVERVNEILELNKKGISPATLEANEIETTKEDEQLLKEKSELARFDDKFKSQKKKKKKKKNKKKNNPGAANTPRVVK
ncbi:MAG TPA: hypothetical protein VIK89_02035, partial [Cytophagaceae bacterium]